MVNQAGEVKGRTSYGPYGKIIWHTGIQAGFAYAGLYHHDASGLYLANYRAYDPNTAHWLKRDPIKEAGGINLYAYVMGNPVSYVDPLGLFTLSLDFIGTAGAGYVGSATISIVGGYSSECGFTFGIQRTLSGGATAGVDVSLGVR